MNVEEPNESPAENWQDLRMDLIWCYEGRPIGRKVRTHGSGATTCWLVLDGTATVKVGGLTVKASRGEWLVCHMADRWQDFSESARIVSIHLAFSCVRLAAEWHGPAAVKFAQTPGMKRALARLRGTEALRVLPPEDRRLVSDLRLSVSATLELREATCGFARELLSELACRGMAFGAAKIRDDRVRASRVALDGRELSETFLREELAAAHGVSASQLDRLWREELGMTPRQYWERRRGAAACERLRSGKVSVKAIAYELGFRHQSQFSLWFRDRTGMTPSEYRRHPGYD